jgi:hypothetical protein
MRPHWIGTWALSLLVAVGWLGMPGGAWGQALAERLARAREVQVIAPSPTPRTFGTANLTTHVIGASEFDVLGSGSYEYRNLGPGLGHLTKGAPQSSLVAWVRLPAGAVVTSVELEACDVGGTAGFALNKMPSPNVQEVALTPFALTGIFDDPGCAFFPVSPLPAHSPLVIDNGNNTYLLEVSANAPTLGVTAVRVYYTLQVSPAPAVASFGDVPTGHPFFQFIEALVRSGITVGCGSGSNYCPDDPLTRGQMAVFMSKALGVHFAP